MAFSQSFSLGENTLNQLDVFEVNVNGVGKHVNNTKTRNRSQKPFNERPTIILDSVCQSPDSGKMLDVVDESPTEKTHLHGSIRERLKNASTSKKSERKYMRRSRSDPITTSDSKVSKSSLCNQAFSEEFGSMFDSTMEIDDTDERKNKKTNIKLDEKFEDGFDKYFQNIQTPSLAKDSKHNETKTSDLIALSDSGESDNVNVSDIERLMQSENNNKTVDLPAKSATVEPKDEFEWDDSEFFNDLIVSQQNSTKNGHDKTEMEEVEDSLADVAFDVEFVSMQSDRNEAEKEMESCFLEVSMQLSDLNATEVKPIRSTGTQHDTSLLSRSITASNRVSLNVVQQKSAQANSLVAAQPIKLSIDSLTEWNCSAQVIRAYKKKGIQNMFEWQAECLNNPKIKNGNDNLVYNAPTSAGKTFVSEVLMIQTVLERKKKVIVILPFISVVREKMYSLQDLLRSSGIRVEGFFGGYTAPGGFESADIAICTIEKANAIVNRLLEQQNIDSIGMVVVDEVHLISDSNRGYILELLLAKILYCSRKFDANIRIVAMSATLPNSELLQNWLASQFYSTSYRPIELREMIKIGNDIFDNSMNLVRTMSKDEYAMIEKDQDHIAQLCIETIVNGAAVIVFCPSKDWCETLATHVAQNIYKLGKSQTTIGEKIRSEINMPSIKEVVGHLRNSPAGLDAVLEKVILYGVAFHHAGLTFDERDIIESSFCKSTIRVIIATSTLSSGVNLPARRVIIRSPMFGGKPMCSNVYKQMIGRAGRMGKDTEGESILICANNNARVGQELIGATLKPITSCLSADSHTHLKRAILEIIASGVATTCTELEEFVRCTLYHSEHQFEINYFANILAEYKKRAQSKEKVQPSANKLDDANDSDFIGKCMQFLQQYEFIRLQYDEEVDEIKFTSTRLGYACLASSMPPSEGFLLFSELQKARQNFVLETDLHAVYLVTPFTVCYQLQQLDWMLYFDLWDSLSKSMQRVGRLVGVTDAFLAKATRNTNNLDKGMLQIHKRFYTALVLYDLINEKPLNQVAAKYKLNRGTLQSLQQTTSTFAGIVKSFCRALNWGMLALIVSKFQDRIFFGVHQDLVDLMKISILNGQRARALFDSGYKTLRDISKANVLEIEKCLIDSISFDVQKREGETNYDAEQRNRYRLLFVTGRPGLSMQEAAQLIISEAREFICSEMGVQNINWSQQDLEKQDAAAGFTNGTTSTTVNPATAITENIQINPKADRTESNANQQQQRNKRRISMDKDLSTPSKRKNNGHSNVLEELSSNESSSDDSDVDSIILDDSLPYYNDENDDFMQQIQSGGNEPVLMDTIHELAPRLQIIDVTKAADVFQKFLKTFDKLTRCGFSLAIARSNTSNGQLTSHRCTISSEFYIYGLAISFHDKYVTHFLSLQDDNAVDFNMKTKFIRSILAKKDLTLEIYDAKTQLKTLLRAIPGIHRVQCLIRDPQVAQWLIQPEDDRSFSKMITLYSPKCIDLSYSLTNENRNTAVTTSKVRASIKACITRCILQEQSQILAKMGNGSIHKAFEEMEMPVQKSLIQMEQTGMSIDKNALLLLSEQISDYIGDLETEIFRLNGKRFAVNSSKQVAYALGVRKKNGAMASKCTRAQLLQSTNVIAKWILEHRSLHAILSKSVQPLLKQISDDNRIYGNSYSFTQTGRISMHEPNLQNVAKDFRTEFIPKNFSCRGAFVVKPNRMLISADFCQLELRVLAHLSEDNGLMSIFQSPNDVFISIAAKWNKVTVSDVTDKMRHDTKQICYGIIYGMGIKSLAASMKCTEEEAQVLHESFHQTYPGIRKYTQKIVNFARDNGFVETIAGRRRYIPDINASHSLRKRAQAERQAVNTTIQGSAADIAKYAILRMERNLSKHQSILKAHADLVLHLHDELLYEVPIEKCKKMMQVLKSSMENCAKLQVPLKVKMKKGQCWATMETVEIE